jgi:hypothetical protein
MPHFDPEDYDLREVPEPDSTIDRSQVTGHIGFEAAMPDLADDTLLEPEVDMSGPDMSTPDLGGGGLASGASPSGGGGRSSGYVPPNSEEYFDGNGLLEVFADVLNDDSSPFAVGVDHQEGVANVFRPDGTLFVQESESGLEFRYVGDRFDDPDYPSDEKKFEGNNLDLKDVSVQEVEKDGELYDFLVSEEVPFDYRVRDVGSVGLSTTFTMDDGEDIARFAESFGVPEEYEGEFDRSYGDL